MESSEKVLLMRGVLSLSYGFLLGIPTSMIRAMAATAPRHLVTAHLAAVIQGALLLALAQAAAFSTLPPVVETSGAALIVAGCMLFVTGAVANWLQGMGDHFAVRSLGWKLLAISGPLNLAGIAIFLVGILLAL